MSNNRTLGFLALLMAFAIFWFGRGLQAPFAYEPVGPRAFPMITAALIAVCGLLLVIRGGGHIPRHSHRLNLDLLLLAVVLLIYALFFVEAGFVLSTAAMAIATAKIFGARWSQAIVTGLVLSVGAYLLFDHGLDVVLPRGLLGDLI